MSPSGMTADLLRQEIDLNALVDALGERAPQLRSTIESRVSSAISARTTSELLTLTVTEGGHTRTVSPSPTPDYAKSLFHYVKGTGGAAISCRIEDVVEAAVVAATTEFYQSEETMSALAEVLGRQLVENTAIHHILEEEFRDLAAHVQREVKDSITLSTHTTVGEQAADMALASATHAMHTTLGATVAALLAKALALPMVKVAVAKAVGAVLASAAFQKVLIILLKKIGVALVLKMLLVKLFGAGAGALVGFIVIPLIVAFLVYEWNTFPQKIAAKMSGQVAGKLVDQSADLNRQVAASFVAAALDEVLGKLHDDLLSPAN
ncbi:hypothetical protein [Nonomuraea endophytica]|uniref:Uncharacterized protein n=1 Tax=Nonomuraea endophytica TaxID=714136 RepID=A0A7W8ADK2_9ACTN|nr:hypothetical protein [Nonomuraea endophytica]MBB5084133.1 hypothetical protein [Nonomuraea endophytica]